MFGLSIEKLILIGVIAAIIVGPERLPGVARTVGMWVSKARRFATEAKTQLTDEIAPELADVNWRELDPRQAIKGAVPPSAQTMQRVLFDEAESKDTQFDESKQKSTPFDSEAT